LAAVCLGNAPWNLLAHAEAGTIPSSNLAAIQSVGAGVSGEEKRIQVSGQTYSPQKNHKKIT